jgi:hypothetical protein
MSVVTSTRPTLVQTDLKYVKCELYDADVMDALLCDTTSFSKKDLGNLSRYKKGRRHGNAVDVVYSYGKGCEEYELGRLYAKGGQGIQSFPFDIRNPLIEKFYWDCDMENAHYNILATLGSRWGVKTDSIQQYIQNRDEELAKVSSLRHVAKTAFLKVAYGGNVKLYDEYANEDGVEPDGDVTLLHKIETEMKTIVDLCWMKHEKYHKIVKNKPNPRFSLFALILQTEERKCLLAMDEYAKTQGRSVDIFIHDGGEVRKLPNEKECPEALLRGFETAIFEATGYPMKVVSKPFKHAFQKPEQVLLDADVLVNDAYAAEVFAKLCGENIILDCGRVWVFHQGLWSSDEAHIQRVVTNSGKALVFKQPSATGVRVFDYSGNVKNTKNLMIKLPDVLPRRDGFFKERVHTDIGKLLFPNGIYDFKTGVFTEDFDPAIVFTGRMPRPFPRKNQELVNEIRQISFTDAFSTSATAAVLLFSLMRAFIGDTLRKKFNIGTGWGNSGKGMLATLLHCCMGMLCSDFNGNCLLYKSGQGESARDNGWMVANVKSRIAIGSEVMMKNDKTAPCIDGNLIKSISSGVDEIKMRGLYKEEAGFVNKATFFMFAQDLPSITPAEKTVLDRLTTFEWSYSYVESPTLPYEKKADFGLAHKYSQAEYGDAFFWLMVEEYEAWKQSGFAEPKVDSVMLEGRSNFVETVNYRGVLEDAGYEFGYPDEYAEFKDILPLFSCSKTLLGRNLGVLEGVVAKYKKVNGKAQMVYFGIRKKEKE